MTMGELLAGFLHLYYVGTQRTDRIGTISNLEPNATLVRKQVGRRTYLKIEMNVSPRPYSKEELQLLQEFVDKDLFVIILENLNEVVDLLAPNYFDVVDSFADIYNESITDVERALVGKEPGAKDVVNKLVKAAFYKEILRNL